MDKQNKDSFILYGNQSRQIEMLSDQEAGALIKKIYRYVNGEDVKEYQLSPIAEMLYSIIEDQIARDRNKYNELCRRRQEAGRKGGRPRKEKPNGFEEKQKNQKVILKSKQKHTDTDTDTVTVTDNDTGTEKTQRHMYGTYKNVPFSDEELKTLKEECPNDWEEWIEKVSSWCASNGKRYKNGLATIRNWKQRDQSNQASTTKPSGKYAGISEITKQATMKTLENFNYADMEDFD